MENTAVIVQQENAAGTQGKPKQVIELAEGRILPGGVWEINPFNEKDMHPDDLRNPIGA